VCKTGLTVLTSVLDYPLFKPCTCQFDMTSFWCLYEWVAYQGWCHCAAYELAPIFIHVLSNGMDQTCGLYWMWHVIALYGKALYVISPRDTTAAYTCTLNPQFIGSLALLFFLILTKATLLNLKKIMYCVSKLFAHHNHRVWL
jgi:hypothetical protein